MDRKQLEMMELSKLHDEWREIKKRKLGQQMDSLQQQMEDIMTDYANGIVEWYKLAFGEDLIVQNKENNQDSHEMLFSMYAPSGIYQEKAEAFTEAFNGKHGTNLVPEVYSDTEFSIIAKI